MEKSLHYNGTIELSFSPGKHVYVANGTAPTGEMFIDEKVKGVTTGLGIIAKPALKFWAVKMACEYLGRNLIVGKSIDEIGKMELIEGCRKAHTIFLKKAADMGTMFHKYVEDYINKKNPPMPINTMLKASVDNFLNWVKVNDVKFINAEQKVLSVKHRYCGTYDFEAIIRGKHVLGDIKTSSGIWDEYLLQVSAYAMALKEEFPNRKIDKLAIVRCGKDGKFETKVVDNKRIYQVGYLAALTLDRTLKQIKKEK